MSPISAQYPVIDERWDINATCIKPDNIPGVIGKTFSYTYSSHKSDKVNLFESCMKDASANILKQLEGLEDNQNLETSLDVISQTSKTDDADVDLLIQE